jgi:hypothetical protein
MVAGVAVDFYAYRHPSMAEEGPQSSEDGSGLHSPVFDSHFTPNDIQYQVDIGHAAGILAAQFDYNSSSLIQQTPLIDTALETPNINPTHVNFSSDYSIPPRNQLVNQFVPQSSVNSRPSHLLPSSEGEILNFRYGSSERRSSGRLPHDPSFTHAIGGVPMDGDQPHTPVSPSERSTGPTGNRSVVIACRQCRSRKIRCDSARPVCTNCHRRKNMCEYDVAPKRRGPDKRPGTRRRSCKKRPADGSTPPPPKRKKTAPSDNRVGAVSSTVDANLVQVNESMSEKKSVLSVARQGPDINTYQVIPTELHISNSDINIKNDLAQICPPSTEYDQTPYKLPFSRSLEHNLLRTSTKMVHDKFPPPPSSELESVQRDWWAKNSINHPIKEIAASAEYLFSDTGHWLSFLNLEYFLETLYHPEDRYSIRPSLIYSILAMATLMKSSQAEYGADGRSQALLLRDAAQNSLEMSWNSGWHDAMLAETALILTLFEMSVHPEYNPDRIATSLLFLDNIVHHLGLTNIDSSDPDVNRYPQGGVPVVNVSGPDDPERRCTCVPVDAMQPPDMVTSWSYPPPWDSSWTSNEIRDEECRRICWCAVGLIANYNAQCAAFNRQFPDFFLSDCSNFTLLFPGEVVDRASPPYRSADSQSQKESVWALYCRSMLLWNYSNILCEQSDSSEINADNAQECWNESQAIQDSLDMHICNLDTALIYTTREYIYNTRINITQVLRSFQGLPPRNGILNRRQAQDWIYYQDQVMKRIRTSIQDITDPRGYQLTRRPFQATWFSSQLSVCLTLFHHDHALVAALDLAKSIVIPMDVMNFLWPCSQQQHHCVILREQLIEACTSVGIEPPLEPEFSIPPALQTL